MESGLGVLGSGPFVKSQTNLATGFHSGFQWASRAFCLPARGFWCSCRSWPLQSPQRLAVRLSRAGKAPQEALTFLCHPNLPWLPWGSKGRDSPGEMRGHVPQLILPGVPTSTLGPSGSHMWL